MTAPVPTRRWAPTRRVAVPTIGALGVVLVATAPATWVHGRTWTALADVAVSVPGSRAAPVVAAAGILVLAAALALAMARRGAAVVAAAVVVGGAVLAAVGAVAVLADADGVAAAGAQRDVGVGLGVTDVAVTAAPWLVLAVAVLTGVAGVAAGLASRGWSTGTRHEAPVGAAPRDEWEALTVGMDPTDDESPAS